MPPRVITVLGLGQLLNWGVLYYAFAVLMPSVQSDLGAPTWHVTGAFSLGLLVSALAAPAAGRWNDRGHAVRAIASGALGAAVLLALWAAFPTLATLYIVWAGLGVCMATSLYEPAFAVITRTQAGPDAPLRALATVTLFGGLASTVFLPATAGLVAWLGWRGATCALAGALALSSLMTVVGVGAARAAENSPGRRSVDERPATRRVHALALLFGAASFVSASFVANLIPTLAERGIDTTTGAFVGGLFGVMQLPGRALMAGRRVKVPGHALLALSLALQTAGLVCVAMIASPMAAPIGVAIFATGSGLTTLARPYLVQGLFPFEQTGSVNGRVARAQQLARAIGPVAVSFVASSSSYSTVLLSAGVGLAALALTAGRSTTFRSSVSEPSEQAREAATRMAPVAAAAQGRAGGRPA